MHLSPPQLNLELAWLWMIAGFLTGLLLGLFFHREDWLGGYGSFKRRLYRLAHISLFGLGVVNLCFYLTVQSLGTAGPLLQGAGWALIVGAISMPVCCLVMAHFPRAHPVFSVPILSLLFGGFLTLTFCVKARSGAGPAEAGLLTGNTSQTTDHFSP